MNKYLEPLSTHMILDTWFLDELILSNLTFCFFILVNNNIQETQELIMLIFLVVQNG